MTKLEKKLGAKENCPNCKQEMVCREILSKEGTKLQWQNSDGKSHYVFDQATQKPLCRQTQEKTQQVKEELGNPQELHLSKIPLKLEEITPLQEIVSDKMDVLAITYLAVRQKLAQYGMDNPNPALVGMFFNRVREELRIHDS